MVFNFTDPCQEFVFEGDAIGRVETFKYPGILLETTSNLDRAMEHLIAANRHSLFAPNRHCAELCIMDVKLHCDLFNTLVHSTTSYACEVWVDSKKIKAIKIMLQRFFKSLLEVRKTTNTSIMLTKFSKFPFEHFAWGQVLNYACCRKNMLGWICEKMATQELALGGGKFSTSDSTVVENGASTYSDPCVSCRDYSTNQLGGWGLTPSRFSPHNVECKKGER
jgi:hypothetical protein